VKDMNLLWASFEFITAFATSDVNVLIPSNCAGLIREFWFDTLNAWIDDKQIHCIKILFKKKLQILFISGQLSGNPRQIELQDFMYVRVRRNQVSGFDSVLTDG